ncbi:MAG: extracellular solute-binding protein [Clostridia bacterium]|nr:extracellular solute-binding protein [Clostridia bacterium]
MKKIIAAALSLMMLLSVAGAFAEAAPVTVSIWSTFTDAQDAYLRQAAADFNAANPGYEVIIQTQPNQGFTSTVYQSVVNGEGPDIIFNYGSEAAKYVEAGLVANLDEYIYDEEIGIEGFDELLPEYLFDEINGFEDGHIHYLPGYTTGPILYYNKTMLNELGLEVPKTWTELEAVCRAIKEAKPDVTPFGIDALTDIAQTLIMEAGYGYMDTENKCVLFGEAVEPIAWLGRMAQEGLFAITAPSGGYFSNDFNSGIVAMYYGSCAGVPYINPEGFEYDVAPAPSTGDENAAYTIWNRGPIVFSANGKEAEKGAYLFAKYFLTTPEVAAGWAEAVLALTPWINAQSVEGYDAFVASQPALAAVAGNFDIGVSFPAVKGASETRDALKELATLVAGGADAAEALANCVETCNKAMRGE